jgi:hypothetical protein
MRIPTAPSNPSPTCQLTRKCFTALAPASSCRLRALGRFLPQKRVNLKHPSSSNGCGLSFPVPAGRWRRPGKVSALHVQGHLWAGAQIAAQLTPPTPRGVSEWGGVERIDKHLPLRRWAVPHLPFLSRGKILENSFNSDLSHESVGLIARTQVPSRVFCAGLGTYPSPDPYTVASWLCLASHCR